MAVKAFPVELNEAALYKGRDYHFRKWMHRAERIRSIMDPTLSHADYLVTDPVFFEGTNSSYLLGAFAVHCMDGSGNHNNFGVLILKLFAPDFDYRGSFNFLNLDSSTHDQYFFRKAGGSSVQGQASDITYIIPIFGGDGHATITGTGSGTPTVGGLVTSGSKSGIIVAGTTQNSWVVRLTSGERFRDGDTLTSGANTLSVTTVSEDNNFDMQFTDNVNRGDNNQLYIQATGGSGTFQAGEVVQTATGKALFGAESSGKVYIYSLVGYFQAGETLTGQTSGATRNVDSILFGMDQSLKSYSMYGNLSQFYPTYGTDAPRGMVTPISDGGLGAFPGTHTVCLNSTLRLFSYYGSSAPHMGSPRMSGVAGYIYENDDPNDTDIRGSVFTATNSGVSSILQNYADFKTTTGWQRDGYSSYNTTLTYLNVKNQQNKHYFDRIYIRSNTNSKGNLLEKAGLVIGGTDERIGAIFAHHTSNTEGYLKSSDIHGYAWDQATPSYPLPVDLYWFPRNTFPQWFAPA